LEAAGIEDRPVAELLQGLAAQCGAPARSTVDEDGFVLLKDRIVVGALRVGSELEHAARHMNRTLELAAGGELQGIAPIDDEAIPAAHPVANLGRVEPGHGGVSLCQAF